MLEYVYIARKYGVMKVSCSAKDDNLPDFETMGLCEKGYEEQLKKYYDFVACQKEEKRLNDEYKELFYGNIGLFTEHFETIANTPKFANIQMPCTLYGSMYISFGDECITLGELVSIYKHEPDYNETCPDCDGKVYLTRFGFSALTGNTFPTHRCYGKCRKRYSGENRLPNSRCHGRSLVNIRKGYRADYFEDKPAHITELLLHLGAIKKVASDDKNRVFFEENFNTGFIIGKSNRTIMFSQNSETRALDIAFPPKAESLSIKDILVPYPCWNENFVVAALKAGLCFGDLPNRFKTQEFLNKIVKTTNYVPTLGEISPKLLTAEICEKAIRNNPQKSNRLKKLIPEHLKAEVERLLSL
jgi:hypothetical protein